MDMEIVKSKITERRKWLRLSQTSVASFLGISKSAMSALESQDSKRSIEVSELVNLCKLFFCTPDELLNSSPKNFELYADLNTRATNSNKEMDNNDILELNFFLEELKLLKKKKQFFKSTITDKSSTEVITLAAQELLTKMGITKAPVDVFDIASRMNIFVKFSVLNNLSGALIHPNNENGAGILLNSNQPDNRIRFSLAHEIAHFYLSHYPNNKSAVSMLGRHVSPIEKDADSFASEILIPNEFLDIEIGNFIKSGISEIEAYKLSDKFAVSYSAMLVKLRNRNYISDSQYKTYSKLKVKDIKNKIEGSNTAQVEFDPSILSEVMKRYHFTFENLNADSIRLMQEMAYQNYISENPIENRANEVKDVYEKVVRWLVEEKEKSSQLPIIEAAKKALDSFDISYTDKSDKGGCLWVLKSPKNDKFIDSLKKRNIFFKFAENGGKATKRQPAWYLNSN